MPTYKYVCIKCKKVHEVDHSIAECDSINIECNECKSICKRVPYAVPIKIKRIGVDY